LTEPAVVRDIHRANIDAGSDILYTNTFGANPRKLAHTGVSAADVITAAVRLAIEARGQSEVPVALDVGPIGELLEPTGTLSFEDAVEIYREIVMAGAQAGADLVVFETMADLYEVKAAVLAAKENTALPVFVTMTFEENHRTFTGCLPESMALLLDGLGVDALGINCSQGPAGLLPLIQRIRTITPLPLILKPNAGMPDPDTGLFAMTAKQFAQEMTGCADLGVQFVGGCCGTTPEFIKELKTTLASKTRAPRRVDAVSRLCSPTKTVVIEGVRVIGERINPTGNKRLQKALREDDLEYILSQGVEQADAGAHILDVNVGLPGIDQVAWMTRVVKGLQGVVETPLQIDADDPKVIEAGLRACSGKAIVNSVNGDEKTLEAVLPLVKKYGAAVVGLTLDSRGIPPTAKERLAVAKTILAAAKRHGIKESDVFIDCLTLPFSAGQAAAYETLRAVALIKKELGLHMVLGVSNASFGLPNRDLAASVFLTMAMDRGLDLAIINPNSAAMRDAIGAFELLSGNDRDCAAYVARYGAAPTARGKSPEIDGENDITAAILKGLKEDAARITKTLLERMEGLDIVNTLLIPALDEVGRRFETGEIFLPQLIQSSQAAGGAFDVVKSSIEKTGGASVAKGKILVATVKGDIHDIGKNIAKTVLSNYGYHVIDLGRDVPIEKIVNTAMREEIRLVGLSALMTTTLKSMEATISALRASGHVCTVFAGGAVLTPDYAKKIGADYYAKDAKSSVDIAKKVLG
jgi:5-methyltetrahydrofolate--homocysteine methyltransferase